MTTREIKVKIVVDTTSLERAFCRAAILVERSWWRRMLLRVALWRLTRAGTAA